MILQALHELYSRLEREEEYGIAPLGRTYQKVSFVVVIEPDGTLVDIQDARFDVGGRKAPRKVLVLGKTKPSGSGHNPCFLWDSTGYLLGWDARPKRAERATETFEAFRRRHLEVERDISSKAFSAVCRFLERWSPSRAADFPILEDLATGFGVFSFRGETRYVHEDPVIQSWWNRRTEADPERMKQWWKTPAEMGSSKSLRAQCLVTGESAPIARLHSKIKGVDGSQSSGATIAGFNVAAFWSYGLEQSFNAPVSVEAARRYVTALNALLDGPMRDKHRVVVGGTTVVFWTDRPTAVEDVFAAFASDGSAALERVQDETLRKKLETFFRALRVGREAYGELADERDTTQFFVLGLGAPTPARITVRFFHRTTVVGVLENLRRHHRDIAVERRFGMGSKRPDPEMPSAWVLLAETRPPGGKVPPLLSGTFLESILAGTRYPEALYTTIMRRVAADRTVNYARACIIKGYLARNLGREVPVSLDTSRHEPGYRLGRLFAALEKTQLDALSRKPNATIRDRFYSSASATPAAVFPRLLRTYQHHLLKLEEGYRINREKLVQEVLDPLEQFPSHLDLEGQGLFALGYYHQMNDFYRSKKTSNGNEDA